MKFREIYAVVNLPWESGGEKGVRKVIPKGTIYSGRARIYTIAVTLAVRFHLFPYRTQKLSSLAPKILNWRRFGKIGSCCIQRKRDGIPF